MPPQQTQGLKRKLSQYGFSELGNTTVMVQVGAEAEAFSVHDTLLCSRSKFFAVALNGKWKESDDRIIKLPDDDPNVFRDYVAHLYFGKPSLDHYRPSNAPADYNAVSKLYVFAEKMQDPQCKNDITDWMLATVNPKEGDMLYYPAPSSIRTFYSGTLASSPARRLLVDMFTNHTVGSWLKDRNLDEFPVEFIWDLAVCMGQFRPLPSYDPLKRVGTKRYHEPVNQESRKENNETHTHELSPINGPST
ncbi:hypothetical protein BU16DRAFT_197075 [Lophium mytilinum]|uniref:BTB domain-containing protein n=1 Tax=Lophium mytilinum TaxID=390894 RepID=A0A6A6RAB5_9PEZI|nr:hypothetical protein BU16DRAFT_197075 [Lophium mytilinum]